MLKERHAEKTRGGRQRVFLCLRGEIRPSNACCFCWISPTGSFRAYTFWTLSEALSRLYQRRFLRPRPHFSAFSSSTWFFLCTIPDFCDFSGLRTTFCKIVSIFCGFSKKTADLTDFHRISTEICRNFAEFQHFCKEWCQDCYISEKSEKNCKKLLQISWKSVSKNVCSKCLRW